ncbi:MAG: DUF885 domain-containing protein [Chitinophagales bacterium]
MRQLIYLLGAALVISGCTQRNKPASDFSDFSNQFIDSLWKYHPVWASGSGYHAYDSMLPLPDSITRNQYVAFIDRVGGQMKQWNFESLTPAEKTDYQLIDRFLASSVFYLFEFKSYQWDPSEYNIGGALDGAIANPDIPLEVRLRNVSLRLERVPAYYEAGQHSLRRISREHTLLAIDQNKGLSYFFTQMFPDSLQKSSLSDVEKSLFRERMSKADKAIQGYITYLEDRLKNDTASLRDFRIGKDLYLKKFQYDIQSRYSADEVYAKALNRKNELTNEMYQLAVTLWPKYHAGEALPKDTLTVISGTINKIAIHHCERDSLLTTIEQELPKLAVFIHEKQLIDLDSTKPLRVRKTPAYMAGVAGASINSPGPYEKNASTYYNVTPLDGYTNEKAESYLREYNDYMLSILNIHEAIPGHYTQQIYANRSPSLVKNILGNGAMIEGWACYVESMMVEAGYRQSPEMQLIYDKWKLRECCNFLLDYNIQVNGWGEKEAVELLSHQAFQETAEAREKYKRATLTQVQLTSYFTGDLEIKELRKEMELKQGNKFSLKSFHEKFLSYGSAPVEAIRQLMLGSN